MIFTSGRNDHEGNIYRIVSGALMKSLLHDTAGGGTLRYYLIASRCLTNDFAPLTKPPSWNRSQREFHSPHVLRHNVSGLEINFFAFFQVFRFKMGENFEFSISSNDNITIDQYYKRVKISNELIDKTCASCVELFCKTDDAYGSREKNYYNSRHSDREL